MPYKKRNFKRKRRPRRARKLRVSRGVIAHTMKASLKYFDQITLNPPSGTTPVEYVFRANDCYDPDFTGIGHQPMGFDQYMAFYTRFRVVGSKISCSFVANDTSTTASSALCGILKSTSANSPLGVTNYVENDKCVYRTIQIGDTTRPISMKYSTKKQQGIKNIMDNIDLSGTVNSGPQLLDYFHVWAGNVNQLSDASTVSVNIHIEYIVIFSDPVQLTQS